MVAGCILFDRASVGCILLRCRISTSTQGLWGQNRARGAGVVPRAPVGLGRERHRCHSLDSYCAYSDRFLSIGMGCLVHLEQL